MREDDATRWFGAVFIGTWRDVPDGEVVPADVAGESRRCAQRWLAPSADPYGAAATATATATASAVPRQRMSLGLAQSPDRLVTHGAGTELVETQQHFIVGHAWPLEQPPGPSAAPAAVQAAGAAPTRLHAALQAVRNTLVPRLSAEAARLVDRAVTDTLDATADAELRSDEPTRLSLPGPPLASLQHWRDLVGLVAFDGRVWIDFLKIEPNNAAPLFRPGLDWFPAALRARWGAVR